MRPTNPAVMLQMMARQQNNGLGTGMRLPAKQFDGIYEATIIDTDVTNPTTNPPGQCRIYLNANPDVSYGPMEYHRVTAPVDKTPVYVEFIAPGANNPSNSIQPRLVNTDDAYSVPPGTMIASLYHAGEAISLPLTMQALDPTNLTISFDIPPRRIVDVDINGEFQFILINQANPPAAAVALFLHGTTTQVGDTVNIASTDQLDLAGVSGQLIITKLIRARIHITDQPVGPIQLDLAAVSSGGTVSELLPGTPVLIQAFASL